ncbi:MAG: peptidoglycan editing factor PgeF [Melioribacteraceae bacterium]|nr:peptidoglycan editing factor PgeF [Melioribacteraceae bacterium]
MKIIRSNLFNRFPEIIFGFSTKFGLDRKPPFHFNLSFSVGDEIEKVTENRNAFFSELDLSSDIVAVQKQVHSDIVKIVDNGGNVGESDALITFKPNLGLAVSSADCVNVYLYDRGKKIIAGIHSGWRGTNKKILIKTVSKMKNEFDLNPEDLFAFFGPSISQKNYEVGQEVAELFDEKYLLFEKGKIFLDTLKPNVDFLIESGMKEENIELSGLCSFDKNFLHSYRREGKQSGRAWGIIAMRDN